MEKNETFAHLCSTIKQRKENADPETSYVAKLMHQGTSKINKKIMEEAYECAEAAIEDDQEHLTYEICDLLFHTFVLAEYKNIQLEDIEKELARRFGTSGIAEKASRSKS